MLWLVHLFCCNSVKKKDSIVCVQENEVATTYGRRLYLVIRIDKISSVPWNLYIVKNLSKGDSVKKHNEDERWADYLGKYFLSDLAQYI